MTPDSAAAAKVRSVSFFRAVSPSSRPIADSTHTIAEISFLVARVELDSGVTGEGFLLSFDYSPRAIVGALHDIEPLVRGRSAGSMGTLATEHGVAAEYFGRAGVNNWARGLVDVAMWDAWARSLGVPIWRLLGAHRNRVPVYGSGGWLSYSVEELVAEARRYTGRGFRGVKIKVGSGDVQNDIERLARVREAVGSGVDIMMDANQGLSVGDALRLAHGVRTIGIRWFEEPLPDTDFDGYQHLRGAMPLLLAMGEREYDVVALRELIGRRALDLWQPDILRLGGVEAWRSSAALAQAFNVPVLPHFYKEYDVPLLCTIPGGMGAEYFDWVDGLIQPSMLIEDGHAVASEEPGWGFRFKDAALKGLS
jgi:L-alanine-DL-glutamate epimerase-like enolase superfamily enzyme